jgi:hypothetical protein
MAINDELQALGNAARRLNDGSEQLNRSIARIDELLGRLMIGIDFFHPRPLAELVTFDREGKRVIELSYLGYCRVQKSYQLAVKTVKVLESKLALATESPGEFVPLLQAPRRLRYAAVDFMPELVTGLSRQVTDVAGAMERRCAVADSLARQLEQMVPDPPKAEPNGSQSVPPAAASEGRPTRPYMLDGETPISAGQAGFRRPTNSEK